MGASSLPSHPTPPPIVSSSNSTPCLSSSLSSLSSSGPVFRPSIHPDIIRRTLMTDFMEATSLPVNVPLHRAVEAVRPGTPMRQELSRCEKELPPRLARRLSIPHAVLPRNYTVKETELIFTLEMEEGRDGS